MSISLETRFDNLVQQLDYPILSSARIFPLVDLTCLDEQAIAADIQALVEKAQQDQVAAICVYPKHLEWIPAISPIQRATVVNFPSGDHIHDQVLTHIEQAIAKQNADEIDYVFAYSAYLAGQRSHALGWCQEAYQLCQEHGRMFKVIIETGAMPTIDMIYKLSGDIIEKGCDILKTSTGKIPVGASLQAAFAMLTAIKDSQSQTGIKISGGVKTLAQASAYVHLAEHMLEQTANKKWFRIGASQIT